MCVWLLLLCGVVACLWLSGGFSSDMNTFGYLQEGHGCSCRLSFVFHTTLTFEALHRDHIVSTAVETISKKNTEIKKARCPHAISNFT